MYFFCLITTHAYYNIFAYKMLLFITIVTNLSRKFYFAHSLLLKQLSGFLYAKIGMEQSPFRRGNAEPYKYVRRRHTRKRLVMSQRR